MRLLESGLILASNYLAQMAKKVRSIARLHHVGAANGMLVVGAFEEVEAYREYLDSEQFGYSVLDQPGEKEVFDLESYREMFCEWGWPGGSCA